MFSHLKSQFFIDLRVLDTPASHDHHDSFICEYNRVISRGRRYCVAPTLIIDSAHINFQNVNHCFLMNTDPIIEM